MFYFLLSITFSLTAQAGLLVTGKLSQGGVTSPLKQFYQNGNTKWEFRTPPYRDTTVIYRDNTKQLVWVEHAKKAFTEATAPDLVRLAGLLLAFRAQKDSPTPAMQLKKSTEPSSSPWKCQRFDVWTDDKKTGRFCVVPLAEVGASKSDFHALASLAKTVQTLNFLPPEEKRYLATLERSVDHGFLVEMESFDNSGKPFSHFLVEKVAKEKFPASTFANPIGYTRNDLSSLIRQNVRPSGK
jgi:hypothetical protein